MPHSLPALPYAYDALEPHLDAQTMEIHHSKHHQSYINNLNAALEGTPYAEEPVEALLARLAELPQALHGALINQGGRACQPHAVLDGDGAEWRRGSAG